MKRIIKITIGLVFLVVILAVVGLVLMDVIIKAGVEKGGSYALGVDTTVDNLKLSLLNGRLEISGLDIANPEGFADGHFMHSGGFDIAVVPSSVFSDAIELTKFEIDSLDVNIEQKLVGSNIGVIINNLKRFDKPKSETEPGKKVKVDKIYVRNVTARFYLFSDVTGRDAVEVKIPEIILNNVTSEDPNGLAVSELVRQIVPAILTSVLQNARGVVPPEVLDGMSRQLIDLNTVGGKLLEQSARQIGKLLEGPAPDKRKLQSAR